MSITIRIFSDFTCPFCYVGKGIVDRLKKDFPIEDIWIPHELHPETPPQGRLLAEVFEPFEIDQMLATLRQRGEPYGLVFGDLTMMCNTRLALEAAEFARDRGRYEAFHDAVLKAYFVHGRNIGEKSELLDIAASVGLEPAALDAALAGNRYGERVEQGSILARERSVTAIPSFFIEDLEGITGAASEMVFRKALQQVQIESE